MHIFTVKIIYNICLDYVSMRKCVMYVYIYFILICSFISYNTLNIILNQNINKLQIDFNKEYRQIFYKLFTLCLNLFTFHKYFN